jgi:hypothetical protein
MNEKSTTMSMLLFLQGSLLGLGGHWALNGVVLDLVCYSSSLVIAV